MNVCFTGRVIHGRSVALLTLAVLTVMSASGLRAAASSPGRPPVRVTFVLKPTWLPSGYSASGGGLVSPPGRLQVYPNTGTESVLIVGSNKHPTVPVLFTLTYYSDHNPESKTIRVLATPAKSAGPRPAAPNAKFGHRKVALYSYTQGALHNLNVDVSWVEDGDSIQVTTQGLPTDQVTRFVTHLVQKSQRRQAPSVTSRAATTVP